MPRIKKAEVEAVIALLDEPADDVETLAKRVIYAIDQARAANPCYMVAVKESFGYLFWGPYWTVNEAERDIGKRVLAITKDGATAQVFRVIRPKDDDVVDSKVSGKSRK